jgi:hypothetical protein
MDCSDFFLLRMSEPIGDEIGDERWTDNAIGSFVVILFEIEPSSGDGKITLRGRCQNLPFIVIPK